MKLNLFLVAVIFSGLFWNACSSKLGTQYLSGLSQTESDSAIVTPQGAVFLFKLNTGGSLYLNDFIAEHIRNYPDEC